MSAALYQLLAPLVDGRCYPAFAPEGADDSTPYIIYQIIHTEPDNTLDGITGHEWALVQIDIYGDYDDCLALKSAVIHALNTQNPSRYVGSQAGFDTDATLYRLTLEYEM